MAIGFLRLCITKSAAIVAKTAVGIAHTASKNKTAESHFFC